MTSLSLEKLIKSFMTLRSNRTEKSKGRIRIETKDLIMQIKYKVKNQKFYFSRGFC